MSRERVRLIHEKLRHAWIPFFSRFGTLTPIQIETIPMVLEGKNVVVASPTASGKTESVVAPIAERFVQERWEELAVLYVVPTRALVNDVMARIGGPLMEMGIKVSVKHGDKPYLSANNVPNFLITTPESLDALMCRRPEIFRTLRAVILDEIHLLDNTYRGDQLRILLRRLKKIATGSAFAVHLLSATLSDPYRIAQRYVCDFQPIVIPGRRNIDYYFVSSYGEVHRLTRKHCWKKVLCFCNLRESVESVAAELTALWHPYPVVVHHGSLARQEREEAERVMKEADVAVCVATSTLEVGIDIGDIALIVLADVPWSIASLLQRIGRGNRREDTINVVAVVKSFEEQCLLEEMFKVAMSGDLPEEPYEPDISVAVQQIFSCLYQNPQGLTEMEITDLLSPLCSGEETRVILKHLLRHGWLEERSGKWFASSKVMDLGERGCIHSNIPDSRIFRVFDIDSGREIGTIAGIFDEVFVLGGKIWRVVSVEGEVVKVRRFTGKALAPLFKRHKGFGAFYWLLPNELKNRGVVEVFP
jgi:ATP-dependent Lhr-like helicase